MNAVETDGELIASSLDQPERFEVIFDRHGASVYRFLRRRVGDQLAEELAAETFTLALRARRRFEPGQRVCASVAVWDCREPDPDERSV
jgi:RNA polymerase sigma-70 factor (ECF subfamily)